MPSRSSRARSASSSNFSLNLTVIVVLAAVALIYVHPPSFKLEGSVTDVNTWKSAWNRVTLTFHDC